VVSNPAAARSGQGAGDERVHDVVGLRGKELGRRGRLVVLLLLLLLLLLVVMVVVVGVV
jgi:hypothetical protein